MALRKEDLDANNDRAVRTPPPAGKRLRITFDVSPELRRRIKIAALQNDLSIGEYLGRILEQAVPDEASVTQRRRHPVTRKTLNDLLQIREEIMQERKGKPFSDSTEIIHQMREERTQELEQL